MMINDIKPHLQAKGLLTVCIGGSKKTYISGTKVFNGLWKNMTDVFGIYKGNDGKYCFL